MSLINPKTFEDGWTQSELATLDNCGFKWKLKYDHLLSRKGSFSWALVFGSAFHKGMEEIYKNKGRFNVPTLSLPSDVTLNSEQEEEKDYYQALLETMLNAYVEKYPDDFDAVDYQPTDIERVADVVITFGTPAISIRLKGMLDLFASFGSIKGKYIWDHKTCGKLSMVNIAGWEFRFQFMFYVWLCGKVYGEVPKGFVVNAIKKTELRQKGGESIRQFFYRVEQDMRTRPEMYFYRNIMKLSKGDMKKFEEHTLYPKLLKVSMLQREDVSDEVKAAIVMNRNTDHCIAYNSVCEFLPICRNGYDLEAFQYETRTVKHRELEGQDE
jgi:hypothetical protein